MSRAPCLGQLHSLGQDERSGHPIEQLAWMPATGLVEIPGFQILVDCVRDARSERRLVPRAATFNRDAFVAGLEILSRKCSMSSEQRFSYWAGSILYELALRQQFFVLRKFQYVKDLQVSTKAASLLDRASVLPEDLGDLDQPWGIQRLLSEGRQAALAAGVRRPTNRHDIAFGLWVSAMRWPLDIASDRVPQLVFDALFCLDETAPRQDWLLNRVEELLLVELEKRHSATTEEFSRQFLDSGSSLARETARRVSREGPHVTPRDIRQCFVLVGWRCAFHVAQCIELFASEMAKSITPPLSPAELQFFRYTYYRTPDFGGLPLIMLGNVVSATSPALFGLLDGTFAPAVFYRFLFYVQEMARIRREADRLTKFLRRRA